MPPTKPNAVYYICRQASRIGFRLFGTWRIQGRENIPASGPGIVISNHTSYLDPPLMGSAIRRPIAYMAKSELFEQPVTRWLYPRLMAFPVRTGTADREAIRRALSLLNSGWLVGLFPEGHRSEDGALRSFQGGLSLIALRSGAPIIPCGIAGAFEMMPPHTVLPHPGHLEVHFGQPIQMDQFAQISDRHAAMAQLAQRAQDAVAQMVRSAQEARESWYARGARR